MKSKWIVERHNRDKESNDHALMLRELQKVVADERISKEKLEQEILQTKDNLKVNYTLQETKKTFSQLM